MKGAYKKRGESRYATPRGGGPYATRKHDRRRRRRLLGVVVLLGLLLALIFAASYLTDRAGVLMGDLIGQGETNEEGGTAADRGSEQGTAARGSGDSAASSQVLLGEFFTDFAWDPDPSRQSNLKTASAKIDGTTLAPGETFSALDTLAPPEDYVNAKVFANGGVDRTEGGGLCQVSSTLYMAANYAGLDIVERNPHYAELPYIQPGLDATVWFGNVDSPALDMKFKNNTDQTLTLREYINNDGFLVAQVYGTKTTGKRVSMDSEKVEENLSKGIKWDTYKTVKDNNGKTLEDGLLFETVYSYNPPVPADMKHETHEPRGSGWLDPNNTTGWNNH